MILDAFDALVWPIFSAFGTVEGTLDTAAPAGIIPLGLLMGLRHAMEGDHVAAVSTMIATSGRKIRRASTLGALWGLGHTATLFAVSLIVLLLAVNIPEKLSGKLEFGVGVMLLFLGITTLVGFNVGKFFRGIFGRKSHSHLHAHQEHGFVHSHNHTHEKEHYHSHRPVIVGMIHGMAGSGALMILVLSTMQSVPVGLAFIASFGAGSIASMAGVGAIIGLPFAKAKNNARLSLVMKYVAAAVTLAVGADLAYTLGIAEQVFAE